MAGSPIILRFRCPGCGLVVEGEAFRIQTWSDGHVFDCVEKRLRIHVLDEAGQIDEGET